jgi:hypothetical protein
VSPPTFIIIGAPRAATTSLHHYLRQHPQVAMSRIKETNYFAFLASREQSGYKLGTDYYWPVRSPEQYAATFELRRETRALGEASPFYLFAPGVPEQIKAHAPDARLLLLLRNPIERAYSAYLKNLREGTETRSFEESIEQELTDPSTHVLSETFYVRAGMYHAHIQRYLQHFELSRIKVVFQEDLKADAAAFMREAFEFIGVDSAFSPDVSVRFNEALPPLLIRKTGTRRLMKSVTRTLREYIPRKIYHSMLNLEYALKKRVAVYPAVSRQTRERLRDQYLDDVRQLGCLLGRDCSHWLKVD